MEQNITGSIDFGYRWVRDVRGNFDTYRSVVNLGEGPKLFGWDFSIQDPKKRFFDRIDTQGIGWGGDPWTTARLNARKMGIYDFRFDYRNIAYFNNRPVVRRSADECTAAGSSSTRIHSISAGA